MKKCTRQENKLLVLCRHEKKRQRVDPVPPPRKKTDQEKVTLPAQDQKQHFTASGLLANAGFCILPQLQPMSNAEHLVVTRVSCAHASRLPYPHHIYHVCIQKATSCSVESPVHKWRSYMEVIQMLNAFILRSTAQACALESGIVMSRCCCRASPHVTVHVYCRSLS